jgi:hypothetical protein
LLKRRWTREGKISIDELSATYANMNEDADADKEEEENASSGGDESAGGE